MSTTQRPVVPMSRRLRRFALFAALLVIVGGLFWWTQRIGGGSTTPAMTNGGAEHAPPVSDADPAAAYMRFAAEERALPDEDAAAQYLAEGLRRLAGVVGTRGSGELDLQVNLRVAATHVVLDPASTANAAIVRAQLIAVAGAVGAPRPAHSDTVRESAAAVVADRPLTQQLPALRRFFRAVGEVLGTDGD